MEIKNIGWIGTGVMGRSMCLHLVKGGYKAFVYNRTKSKAKDLLDAGATWCENPMEVARHSDVEHSFVFQNIRSDKTGIHRIRNSMWAKIDADATGSAATR